MLRLTAVRCTALITLLVTLTQPVIAQRTGQQRSKPAYLSFEIIAPPDTGSRVSSQEWGRVFQKLGHSVRIRTQTVADGTGPRESVTETETATARRIKAVGLLDRKGRVHFGSNTFSTRETERLRQWIDSLRKFGKQGNPTGQPLWGLKAEVFGKLYDAISKPAPAELKGLTIDKAIAALELPKEYPVVWDESARKAIAGAPVVQRELRLYGRPTAMAMILSDVGLGFFPQRQPDGSVKLMITRKRSEPLWPLGWQPKASVARTVPNFYNQIEVELPDVSLSRLFRIIGERTKIPIMIDEYNIRAKGLEFDKMKVIVTRRRMSWNRVIQTATIRNRLGYDIRVDELGKPFVWISTPEIIKARRERFQPK